VKVTYTAEMVLLSAAQLKTDSYDV